MDVRERFVRDLYLGVLKRPGEQEGVSHFLQHLGESPSFQEAADLLNAFVGGSEARDSRLWRGSPAQPQDSVTNLMSIGTHCLTSYTLKTMGLKRRSGPFDWTFSSLPMVLHCIQDDFSAFLDKRYIEPVPEHARVSKGANLCHHAFYRDQFGVFFVFNHYDVSRDAEYEYYVRCVDRFRSALHSQGRSLFLAVTYEASDDDFGALCDAMEEFRTCELLILRAIRSNPDKFGAELAAVRGRHKLYNLYMTGALGPVSFEHSADEVTFRRLLDTFAFDL